MIKLILSFTLIFTLSYVSQAQPIYPLAAKSEQQDNYHGVNIADPYRWMEDENSVATKTWIAEENKLTRNYLSAIPFRDLIKKRISELYNYTRYGAPFRKGGYI